jgi:hypothetical protein
MRMSLFTSSASIATVALSALVGLSSCDPVQPTPSCRVRPSKYAARYKMDGSPQGMCEGKILGGEVVNLNYYRDKKDYAEGAPLVGITPASVAEHLPEDPKEPLPSGTTYYSIGQFSAARPGDDDQCKVPSLSETKLTAPLGDLSYKWSDFKVVVSPLSAAIYFGANLERREEGCTVKYKVTAIYPATFCGDAMVPVLDPDGKPKIGDDGKPEMEEDPEHGKPVAEKCNPVQGSGLYPDIDYKCDASEDGMSGTHLCLPVQDFPALK